jgi:hypothetical protein
MKLTTTVEDSRLNRDRNSNSDDDLVPGGGGGGGCCCCCYVSLRPDFLRD